MAYSCDVQVPWDMVVCANEVTNGLAGMLLVLITWFISYSWLQGQDGDMTAATLASMLVSVLLFMGGAVSEWLVFVMMIMTPVVALLTRK